MSKRSVAVEIAGQQYRIRSDAEEASLQRLAAYVDRAMRRVREGTGTVDSLDVAVLTCLNLAREILTLRDQRGQAVDDGRLRSLIDRVESAVGVASAAVAGSPGAGGQPRSGDAWEEVPLAQSTPRTLDLPSVEALRERPGRADAEGGSEASEMPEAKIAVGGRDRAS